jgi:aryl carrier-like protein
MPFEKMTAADFNEVMPSKVTGVWNLHNALVNLRLEYFVVLSSIAGVIGSNGQAAYAAANTFLDSFARYRARCGLAGTAISLPPVLDAGFILEHPERKESILKNFGGQSVQNKHLLAILGTILAKPHLEEHRGHVLVGFNSVSDSRNLPSCYSRDLRFQFLLTKENGQPETRQPATQTPLQAIQTKTRDASFATEASSVISQELSRKLSSILGRPVEEIHSQRSIAAYGLDSLNAIELRNWIAKELKVNFQVLELLTSDSVYHLSQLIIGKMVNRKAQ